MEVLAPLPSVTRLSKTVLRILGQNPGNFTLQGTNTYLLGERNPYILIDTGEGQDEYIPILRAALLDEPRDTTDEPMISDIIITHKHHDHTAGLPSVLALLHRLWNEQQPAPTASYRPPRIHKVPLSTPDPRLSTILDSLTPGLFTPSPNGTPVHDLSDSDTFPIPSSSSTDSILRIIHTPGHTPDSLCLHYPPDHALFTADTVLGHGTAVFEDLGPYMASLRKLIDFAHHGYDGAGSTQTQTYTTVYPGHGPVVADGLAKIEMYLRHRVEREEQIVKVLRQPGPGESESDGQGGEGWTIDAIVATIYAKYPRELWAPAAHSVEHHLRKLEDEGRVENTGTAWVLIQ